MLRIRSSRDLKNIVARLEFGYFSKNSHQVKYIFRANYVQLPNGKKQVLGDLSEDEKKRRVGLARQLAPADKEQLRYPYMVRVFNRKSRK